jgi:hypothetical protein
MGEAPIQMGTVAILLGGGRRPGEEASHPDRNGSHRTVPIPGCEALLCKYCARIPGGGAPIRLGVFPFGIVVSPAWMGMTHSELESVRSTGGGMPHRRAGAAVRGGIVPGRKGTVAA